MKWNECVQLMADDYHRLKVIGGGDSNFREIAKILILTRKNFVFFFRLGSYFRTKRNFLCRIVYAIINFIYERKQLQTGIQLPLGTKVGGGIAFIHYSNIVIARSSVIGKNCTFLQGITLGHSFSSVNDGTPKLGDNVVVFAGAKILGNVHIGDKAVIAANSVVTKDVPSNCIAAGIPAKIVRSDTDTLFGERWKKDYARL